MQGVSCASTALCVAVDRAGQVITGHWEGPLPAPPVASAPPAITGTATAGQLLTATHGTWTNEPDELHGDLAALQQRRQRLRGRSPGPSGESYRLTADDVGHTLRVREIASGLGGTGAPSVSPATAVVKAAPVAPVASAPPAITGTARVGELLTATHGTWANSPTSYTDTWQRCANAGSICNPIAGANGLTYRPTAHRRRLHAARLRDRQQLRRHERPGHLGAHRAREAAPTGGGGGGTGEGGGGTGGGGAGGTGGGGGGGGPAPAPALVRATTSGPLARVTVSCVAACRLTLTITVTETLRRGKVIAVSARKRKVVIGKATATLTAGQSRTVRVSLNKAGRKLLSWPPALQGPPRRQPGGQPRVAHDADLPPPLIN